MANLFSVFRKVETKSIPTVKMTEKEKTAAIADQIDQDASAVSNDAENIYSFNKAHEVLRNPIAKKCIDLIANSASSIRLYATKNDNVEVPNTDPLAKLLEHPNNHTSINEFINELVRHYLLSGEAYVHRVNEDRDFVRGNGQIFLINPAHVNPQGGSNPDFPLAWHITPNVGKTFYEQVDQVNGYSRLLQIREYNPTPNYRGIAPAAAAWGPIKAFNSGTLWNTTTLDGGGSFKAIMQVQKDFYDEVSSDQWNLLQKIVKNFSMSKNGSVLMPNIPVDLKEMSRSPKDMQLTETQDANSRQITVALGVPGQLANIPGDSTYANYEQASYAFYQDTVIPLMRKISGELTQWFQPIFPGYKICVDIDSIETLKNKRTEAMKAIQDINFLSVNEKRDMFGFGKDPGGNVIPGTVQITNIEETTPQDGDTNQVGDTSNEE